MSEPTPRVPDPRATPAARAVRPQHTFLDVKAPRPVQSVLINGWPMIAVVLIGSYAFAMLFPALGGLLLVAAPIAVLAALAAATYRVRQIRLTVTDEVIRVSNAKSGRACDRAEVQAAVLVEALARHRFGRRSTDLILLDKDGKTGLLLSGALWPPATLDEVIDVLAPLPVERVGGTSTPMTLAARYPKILQNTDGNHVRRPRR